MHYCIGYLCTFAMNIFTSLYIWQLLYTPFAIDNYTIELLKLTNSECKITNANFCMHHNWHLLCTIANNIHNCPFCNLYAILQLKTFTCPITVANFSIYFVHNIIIYKYLNAHNGQLLHDLLLLITIICTVAKNYLVSTIPIHNFCMYYWILQLFASLLQKTNCMQ